jgi:hypothetical protein
MLFYKTTQMLQGQLRCCMHIRMPWHSNVWLKEIKGTDGHTRVTSSQSCRDSNEETYTAKYLAVVLSAFHSWYEYFHVVPKGSFQIQDKGYFAAHIADWLIIPGVLLMTQP